MNSIIRRGLTRTLVAQLSPSPLAPSRSGIDSGWTRSAGFASTSARLAKKPAKEKGNGNGKASASKVEPPKAKVEQVKTSEPSITASADSDSGASAPSQEPADEEMGTFGRAAYAGLASTIPEPGDTDPLSPETAASSEPPIHSTVPDSARSNPAGGSSAERPVAISENAATDPHALTTPSSSDPISTFPPEATSVKKPVETTPQPPQEAAPPRQDIYSIILEKLKPTEIRTCNAILELLADRGEAGAVAGLANAMEQHGLKWDSATYEAIIRDAVRRNEPDRARRHLDEMRAHNLSPTPGALNAVVVGLARANRLADAEVAFKEMGEAAAEARTLAALMNAQGRSVKDRAAFVENLKRFVHAAGIVQTLPADEKLRQAIRALVHEGFELTLSALHALSRDYLNVASPKPELYDSAIAEIIDLGDSDSAARALKLLEEIAAAGLSAGVGAYNRVLEALPTGTKAQKLLEDMMELGPQPTTKSFNAVIARHMADGDPARARAVEKKMRERNVPPDSDTYQFLANGGHTESVEKGFKRPVTTGGRKAKKTA
ncbi:hypothetical protein BDK51DRAFT_44380 [Blyttiomyces helicus]|uniref:Pentacotripeptide-repeat region of PRORP domain-containing protein n=1 Tax=Blyttiomyces helicus TaxID=388810 RepID=A0A4P9VWR3_9FUNG|nr:hypothetical protein BDK51DRAFT_44380 [Blyttiomyces helicus]|eukprot:RKO84159.1 hypothetical protein BDK51DRAFT_44380 [Blyttiomyces helicus]